MLELPKPIAVPYLDEAPSDTAVLCGIDPGTDKLGLSFLTIDVKTNVIVGVSAYTLCASRDLSLNPWIEEVRSPRTARLFALENTLVRIFRQQRPLAFACESPFFNRFQPNAFEALVEAVRGCIHKAIWRYDVWRSVVDIDPMTVKKVVGASYSAKKSQGKTRDEKKQEVKDAVLSHALLAGVPGLKGLVDADEHTVDATAIVLYLYIEYYHSKNLPAIAVPEFLTLP